MAKAKASREIYIEYRNDFEKGKGNVVIKARKTWWLDTDGGHAFSRDGRTWTYSGVAWGNAEHPRSTPVRFDDGMSFSFTRLERPHLIFDAKGAPMYLVNAAQYGPGKLPGTLGDNGDASYTLVRPILQRA